MDNVGDRQPAPRDSGDVRERHLQRSINRRFGALEKDGVKKTLGTPRAHTSQHWRLGGGYPVLRRRGRQRHDVNVYPAPRDQ